MDWDLALRIVVGVTGLLGAVGLGTTLGAILQRRTGREEVIVKAKLAENEELKVQVLDKEAAVHQQAELRAAYDTAIEFHLGVIRNLDARVKAQGADIATLQTGLHECHEREAVQTAKLVHLLAWATALGYEAP